MILRDLAAFGRSRALGTCLASFGRASLLLGAATGLMGCLITQRYDPPDTTNRPPTFVSPMALATPGNLRPFDQIVWVDLTQPSTSLVFDVTVRELDLEDPTQYRVFVDYSDTLPPDARERSAFYWDTYEPPVGNDQTDRVLPIRIETTNFRPGCHRVEVLATSKFQSPDSGVDTGHQLRDPFTKGDIAQVAFWVAVTDASTPTVDMGTCPR